MLASTARMGATAARHFKLMLLEGAALAGIVVADLVDNPRTSMAPG
jgi:hypothetical protein